MNKERTKSVNLSITKKNSTVNANSTSSYKSKDISNYVISFEGVWSHKELGELFYNFLKKELSVETYDFIQEVDKLSKIEGLSSEDVQIMVKETIRLVETYIKEGAKRELNIAAPLKKKILEQYNQSKQKDSPNAWKLPQKPELFFGEARKSLFSTLKHDSFKRFIRTKEFTTVIQKYVGLKDVMIPRVSHKFNYDDTDFAKPIVADKDFDFVDMLMVDGFNWELIGTKFEHGNLLTTYWSNVNYMPNLTACKKHKLHTLKYECVLNCRFNQAISLFPNGALYDIDPNTAFIDTKQYWEKNGDDLKRDHYVSKSSIIFPFPMHQRVFYACVSTHYDPKKKRLIEILKPFADTSKGEYCEKRKEELIERRGAKKYVEKDCYLMFDLMAVIIEKIDEYKVAYAQIHNIGIGGWSDLDFMSKTLTHDRGVKLRNSLVKKLKDIPEDITFEELSKQYEGDSMMKELISCEGLAKEFPIKKDGKVIMPEEIIEVIEKKEEPKLEEKIELVEKKEEPKLEEKKETVETPKEEIKDVAPIEKKEEPKEEQKVEEKKEEPKEEVKPVVEEPKEEEKKEESKINLDASKTFQCPSKLHKYIIGDKGSIIKGISSESKCKLDLKDDHIEFNGEDDGIIKAKELVLKALGEVGWFFENNQWVERTKQDELWKKYRGEAEKEVQLRGEKFEKSKQAFESGDKDLAKQLSDEAKQHDENFKRLNKEAGENIFNEINKENSETTIDLHGLFVEEALGFVEERINKLKGSNKTLEIITGAGNHSKTTALIKPKIIEMLTNHNISYQEVKNGQIDAVIV